MEPTRVTLDEQPYLYVDRECPYGPEIADAMASAFGEMFTFMQDQGITPASMPISVYVTMDPDKLRFRGGFMVQADDASKASGNVKADVLPGGEVMTVTHVGSYAQLSATHSEMENAMAKAGTPSQMPIWEHYIDDPGEVAEAEVRTEIFRCFENRW